MSIYSSAALATPETHPDTESYGYAVQCPQSTCREERKDYFVRRDGREFAGTHIIVDFWDANGIDNLKRMERALRDAVVAGCATLLHIHLHHFTPNGGISGVAVLAESHISVHTWPERRFAAFDVFMCGEAQPDQSIASLIRMFRPGRVEKHVCLRGVARDG